MLTYYHIGVAVCDLKQIEDVDLLKNYFMHINDVHSKGPLKLWIQTLFMARCTQFNIMWNSWSVTYDTSLVFSGYSDFLHL
jgi:hypothetical protein